ncbi:MAG: PrsW family glutamic-type intramembrane protease [Zavarzinia sp.]|nr:PrsW family glutamic-type intramembrane protease [Zavarzinia sp.]
MTPGTAIAGFLGPLAIVALLRWRYGVTAPSQGLIGAFVAGAAGAFLALVVEEYLWPRLVGVFPTAWGDVFRAFILIALTEETIKLSLIHARGSDAKDPSYGAFVIAAAAVGAGFAACENLLYLHTYGPDVLWIRLATATPFHIFNAVLAAWAIARHLVGGRMEWTAAALTLSVLAHGFYDYALISAPVGNSHFLLALALVSLVALAILRRLRPVPQT